MWVFTTYKIVKFFNRNRNAKHIVLLIHHNFINYLLPCLLAHLIVFFGGQVILSTVGFLHFTVFLNFKVEFGYRDFLASNNPYSIGLFGAFALKIAQHK